MKKTSFLLLFLVLLAFFSCDVGILPEDMYNTQRDEISPPVKIVGSGGNTLINSNSTVLSWPEQNDVNEYEVMINGNGFTDLLYTTSYSSISFTSLSCTANYINYEGDEVNGITYLPNGSYTFKVRYKPNTGPISDWSEESSFEVSIPRYNTLSINNSIYTEKRPEFKWPGLGALQYQIEIDDNSSFYSPVSNTVDVSTADAEAKNPVVFVSDQDLYAETYYWRYRRVEADGSFGDWSPTFSREVRPTINLSSSGVSFLNSINAKLKWEDISGSAGYEISINGNGFTNLSYTQFYYYNEIELSALTCTSSYTNSEGNTENGTTILPNGTYTYKVRYSVGVDTYSEWSDEKSFEVSIPRYEASCFSSSSIASKRPEFTFPGLGAEKYEVEINGDRYINSFVTVSPADAAAKNSVTFIPTEDFYAGTYRWKYRRVEGDDSTGDWSPEYVLEVDFGDTVISSPSVGSSSNSENVYSVFDKISWSGSYSKYKFEIYEVIPSLSGGDDTYEMIYVLSDFTTLEVSSFKLQDGKQYAWRIKGYDIGFDVYLNWSPFYKFTLVDVLYNVLGGVRVHGTSGVSYHTFQFYRQNQAVKYYIEVCTEESFDQYAADVRFYTSFYINDSIYDPADTIAEYTPATYYNNVDSTSYDDLPDYPGTYDVRMTVEYESGIKFMIAESEYVYTW